jgi:hypothetical protein
LTIGTVITATNALQTRDESLNTLGSSDVSYSIVDDNTGLFNTGGGLSINTATGVISGTPTIGKSGTFKIKAIGTVGTN